MVSTETHVIRSKVVNVWIRISNIQTGLYWLLLSRKSNMWMLNYLLKHGNTNQSYQLWFTETIRHGDWHEKDQTIACSVHVYLPRSPVKDCIVPSKDQIKKHNSYIYYSGQMAHEIAQLKTQGGKRSNKSW
jgi:hypothetical protein